jgi:hypothetical protein
MNVRKTKIVILKIGRRKEGSKVGYTGASDRNIGSEQGKATSNTFNLKQGWNLDLVTA